MTPTYVSYMENGLRWTVESKSFEDINCRYLHDLYYVSVLYVDSGRDM